MASDVPFHWPTKKNLFGVEVSITRYQEVVDAVMGAAVNGQGGVATFLAVHGIVSAVTDSEFRRRVNACQIVGPDGQPVRWAMNFFHKAGLEDRVYGPRVMWLVCQRCAELGLSIFLCGSTPVVLALLASSLREMFPDLRIAGADSPPFRPLSAEENDALCQKINRSGAAVAFIGLGVPRQETFADKNRDKIRAVQLCVGAAFDFHAGSKRTAPALMQRWGLEWLFRLSQEPGRLWKRYLITNSIFIGLCALNALKRLRQRCLPRREVGI